MPVLTKKEATNALWTGLFIAIGLPIVQLLVAKVEFLQTLLEKIPSIPVAGITIDLGFGLLVAVVIMAVMMIKDSMN